MGDIIETMQTIAKRLVSTYAIYFEDCFIGYFTMITVNNLI